MSASEQNHQAAQQESFSFRAMRKGAKSLQFATFYLDGELFGINILQVQEILMQTKITVVPLAPAFVLGLISLRGQIVTAINLKSKLGITNASQGDSKYIVIKTGHTIASMQVDEIGEVLEIPAEGLEPPSESIKGIDIRMLEGVYPLKHEILAVLNIENLMHYNG